MCGPNRTGFPCPAGSSTFCPPRVTKLPPTNTSVASRYAAASSPIVSSTTTSAAPAAAPPRREAALRGHRHDAARALHVARRDDELQPGRALGEVAPGVDEQLL